MLNDPAFPPPPAGRPPPAGEPARALWPLEAGMAFLNHGSFGATPHHVLAAQEHWRRRMEAQPVRFLAGELPDLLRRARARLAAFLGAEASDLVFVDNATTGVNAVLRSARLAAGDRLVTTSLAYEAVRKAMSHVCERAGASLVTVELPLPLPGPEAVTEAVLAALAPNARLLVVDHVASASAAVLPVAALVAGCRARGVPVLVDGAHAPGMIDLDLPALAADWYVGNAHKWLCAPKGAGFLWARAAARADLHPPVISLGLGDGWQAEFDWVGTRDPSAWLAVPAALDFHRWLGDGALRTRNRALALGAGGMLAAHWRTHAAAPPAMTGAMASVRLPVAAGGADAARRLHDRLWHDHRIEVPVIALGDSLWLRISAQAYNHLADYEALATAVPALL